MRKLLGAWFLIDPNERKFWTAMLLLLIGFTGYVSVFLALIVVGGVIALESMITSYMAALINARER